MGAVVAIVTGSVASGCGHSHPVTTAAATTAQAPTSVSKATRSLVAESYPKELIGSLNFSIDRRHADPSKPLGWHQRYAIDLTNVALRLTSTRGSGVRRAARYVVTGAHATFTGFEDSTNNKCKTMHIVWGGRRGKPIGGVLEISAAKFSSPASYEFLVPELGTMTTNLCGTNNPRSRSTVTRTARITGGGSLALSARGGAPKRFVLLVQVQAVTAGRQTKGGYTINGSFRPPAGNAPVKLCRLRTGRLHCPAH